MDESPVNVSGSDDLVQDERTVKIYDYEGVKYSEFVPRSTLDDMKTFQVRDDDTFIIAYPKCGTHWMAEIVALILAGGDLNNVNHDCLKGALGVPMATSSIDPFGSLVPYHKAVLESMTSPRVIMTHLPVHLLPPQFWTSKARAIYMARNPRDAAVSYHQFWKLPGQEDLSKFVKTFLSSDMIGQCPLDHFLDYWKHRDDDNMLFLKYEDIKRDPVTNIKRVADHLRRPLTEGAILNCVNGSSIETMKETYAKIEKEETNGILMTRAMGQSQFIRTGEIGTWKKHFTVALDEYFEKIYRQKMSGSDLVFDFE